ncbi:MAG: glycoside hydrolase [Anaerotruncus sp.]|nr:MAG: glycoside hydrolase [Anaerotruncus sp.]
MIAAADKASCGADWGYIELAVRRSEDGGKTWSDIESVAVPPARETRKSAECYASAFYIDPCMAVTKEGEIIMLADFFGPNVWAFTKSKLLDKKEKSPMQCTTAKMLPLIYDRNNNFFIMFLPNGEVLDSKKRSLQTTQ